MDSAKQYIRRLYAKSVASSLSSGASQPFVAVYAAVIGASSSQIGLLHAFSNLAANAFQPLWGFLSDRYSLRVKPIMYSGLISSLLWIPILFTRDPGVFILLIAVQSIISSAATPIFTALIAEAIPAVMRSGVVAITNFWGQVGSISSTIVIGAASLAGLPGYALGFSVAAITGVVSAMFFLGLREPSTQRTASQDLTVTYVIRHIASSREFLRFCAISNLYGFYMSIAWPAFTLSMVKIMNLSFFEIAVLSFSSGAAGLVASRVGRGFFESLGDVRSLMVFRTSLTILPLIYAFTPLLPALIAANIVAGVANIAISISLLLYTIRITSVEDRGTFTAIYNLLQGVSFFFGSLVGGQLIQQIEPRLGLLDALRITLLISALGRVSFGVLHTQLSK